MGPERFLNGRVVVKVSDITQEDVDAIVNAANSSLMGGGGVDGAIHRAGGPEILEECKKLRRSRYPDGLPPGVAAMTTAGKMAARNVIHTVGPVYGKGRQGKGMSARLLLRQLSGPGCQKRAEDHRFSRRLHGSLRLPARGGRTGFLQGDCGLSFFGSVAGGGSAGFFQSKGCGGLFKEIRFEGMNSHGGGDALLSGQAW